MLVQQAKSGDLHVSQHATWRMSGLIVSNLELLDVSVMPNQCYCAPLGDCSGKVSREHYISHVLLRLLAMGDTVRVEGVSAINGGEPTHLSPNALASKILCQHHNAMLSGLDATAFRFFSLLRYETPLLTADIDCAKLELWYLKLLIGLLAVARPEISVPVEWLELLVGRRAFPPDVGLSFQFTGKPLKEFYGGISIELSFSDPEITTPCGVWSSVSATSAYLMLDPEVGPGGRGLSLRPAYVSVAYPDKVKIAWLGWEKPGPGVQYLHPGPVF